MYSTVQNDMIRCFLTDTGGEETDSGNTKYLHADRYAERGKETYVEYKETFAYIYVVTQETYETNINS
jgi:hypothetical protein